MRKPPAGRVIAIGVSLAIVAASAQIVAQVLDVALFDLRLRALDSDTHRSIFGVISLLALAGTVALVGLRSLTPPRRAAWLVLMCLTAMVLVVRALVPGHPAVFVVPVVLAFALFWRLTAADDPAARIVLRVGLGVLAVSFVVHVVGPRVVSDLGDDRGSWPYQLNGILKHSTELAGWILVGAGVLAGWLASRDAGERRLTRAGWRERHWPA